MAFSGVLHECGVKEEGSSLGLWTESQECGFQGTLLSADQPTGSNSSRPQVSFSGWICPFIGDPTRRITKPNHQSRLLYGLLIVEDVLPQFNVKEERVNPLSCPSVKMGSWSVLVDGESICSFFLITCIVQWFLCCL